MTTNEKDNQGANAVHTKPKGKVKRTIRWLLNPELDGYKRAITGVWFRAEHFGRYTKTLYDRAWIDPKDIELAKTVRQLEESSRFHQLRSLFWLAVSVFTLFMLLSPKTMFAKILICIAGLVLLMRFFVDVYVSLKASAQIESLKSPSEERSS